MKLPKIYDENGSLSFVQHIDIIRDMKYYGVSEEEIEKYIRKKIIHNNRENKLKRILNDGTTDL